MADPETLAALKRAYADTILNTTKEAAARVMISEKKARRYQQELATVRDEAVHTLLRLKHMFESKVKETEMMSLKQQQKVEELEAQLGEAEDIVGELRMELQVLREELKRVTNGQANSDHDEDSYRNGAVPVVPEVCSSQETSVAIASCIPVEQSGSVVANGVEKLSLTRVNSINRCSSKDNNDRCHHTLPSILTKRERGTRMITEVDRSMVNGDLSLSVEVGDVNDGVSPHKVPSYKSLEILKLHGCADGTVSTSPVFNDVRNGEDPMASEETSQKDSGSPLSLKTSQKDATVSASPVFNDVRNGEDPMASEETSQKDSGSPLSLKTSQKDATVSTCTVFNDVRNGEDPMASEKTSQKDSGSPLSLKTSQKDATVSTSPVFNDVRNGEDPMASEKISQKDFGSPLSLKTSPSEHENHNKTVISETEAKKEEIESCVNIEVSASPLREETPVLAGNKNRCIKYTFKRKRKKEVISNPEGDSSLEESTNKKQKTGEKDDGYLESLLPSFTNESSRDSLRVAQLARQLIPFSEKKGFAAELVNQ